MKHLSARRKFGRDTSHRVSMFNNLCVSLFEHKKIKTTLPKAKEVKPIAEKLITIAIDCVTDESVNLSKRRLLMSKMRNNLVAVDNLLKIASIVKNRQGGYLRIIKGYYRQGDFADVGILEFVDSFDAK